MRWVRCVARMVDTIQALIDLAEIPEANAPLRGNMRRWNDNINMDLNEMIC
jgi:hypothetical protein